MFCVRIMYSTACEGRVEYSATNFLEYSNRIVHCMPRKFGGSLYKVAD